MRVQLFSKVDSSPEGFGGPWHRLFWGGASSFLTPKEPCCACAVSPLPQGWEICDLLMLYSNKVLAPLCSCHDCYLQVSSGDKAWRLVVNIEPGAYLSPVSGNANSRLVVSVRPKAHLFLDKKCKQEASYKYLAWSPSIYLQPQNTAHKSFLKYVFPHTFLVWQLKFLIKFHLST